MEYKSNIQEDSNYIKLLEKNVGIGTTSPNTKLQVSALNSNYVNLTAGFSVVKMEEGYGMYMGVASSGNSWIQSATYNNSTTYPLILNGAGGNVGIGTTSPSTMLHVSGGCLTVNGALTAYPTNGGIQLYYTPGVGVVAVSQNSSGTNADMAFSVGNNAERMRITSAGNVGIGTTSPTYKLHVIGDSFFESGFSTYTSDGLFSANARPGVWTRTPGGAERGVRLGYRDFGSGQYFGRLGFVGISNWSTGIANSAGTSFSIGLNNDTATDYLTITDTGNVGIGTSAPAEKLDVNGNITLGTAGGNNYIQTNGGPNGTAHYYSSGVGNGSWDSRPNANSPYITQWHTGLTFNASSYYGGIRFYNQAYPNIYSSTLVMSIANDNVGIGNASPSQKLHVTGNARITGAIYDSSNSAGASGQVLSSTGTGTAWVTGGGGGGISGSGTTNYIPKFTGSTSVGNSLIYDTGTSIGINTSTPGAVLDVQGSVNIDNGYAFVDVTSNEAWIGAQAGNGGYSYAGGEAGIGGSGDSMATLTSRNTTTNADARFGLQGLNSSTGDEYFFTAKKVIIGSGPSDPYTPKKWMKIWSEDNAQFYWINLYE